MQGSMKLMWLTWSLCAWDMKTPWYSVSQYPNWVPVSISSLYTPSSSGSSPNSK